MPVDLLANQPRDLLAPTQPVDLLAGTPLATPVATPQTTQNTDLASQAGLALRATAKGLSVIPSVLSDAFTGPANWILDKLEGPGKGFRYQSALPALDSVLTQVGLPAPDTPTQRIASKGIELGVSGGVGALASKLASAGAEAGTWWQSVLSRLAQRPDLQVASGIGSGLAGQQSAESGNGWGGQFVSSILGGLAGAGAMGAINSIDSAITNAVSKPAVVPQPLDITSRVEFALQRQGIDPASVPPAIKAALMKDASEALDTGGNLNDAALGRLAQYRMVGATPTVGRLTLDPYAVTQEQNASKLAAATGNKAAKLPDISAQNNGRLISTIEDLNPISDRTATGAPVVSAIAAHDAALKNQVDALYANARGLAGRDAVLNGQAFASQAALGLKQSLSPPLGSTIDSVINDISTGKTPLTVDYAEQLKTQLARLQRTTSDGGLKHAYGIVYKALVDAPLAESAGVNPGMLPAVQGSVPPSASVMGQEAIDAFNAARAAAKARFNWQESAAPITNALRGATPETFVQNSLLSPSVSVADATKAASVINADPAAQAAIRSAIIQRIKDAAIGKGNAGDTGNFSGRNVLAVLSDIGDRKLSLFFDPEEIATLKAAGRVGTLETFQPRGSAVNNSNTASSALASVGKIADLVAPYAGHLPFGKFAFEHAIQAPINSLQLGAMERGALNLTDALGRPIFRPPLSGGLFDPLMLPALAGAGGLLSSPPQ